MALVGLKGGGHVTYKRLEAIGKVGNDVKGMTAQEVEQMLSAKPMTEEEYLQSKGFGQFGGADLALHRGANLNKRQQQVLSKSQLANMEEHDAKRQELRGEYRRLVAQGKIREPGIVEESLSMSKGHSDNPSVQAARRVLEVLGIDWKTGKRK